MEAEQWGKNISKKFGKWYAVKKNNLGKLDWSDFFLYELLIDDFPMYSNLSINSIR